MYCKSQNNIHMNYKFCVCLGLNIIICQANIISIQLFSSANCFFFFLSLVLWTHLSNYISFFRRFLKQVKLHIEEVESSHFIYVRVIYKWLMLNMNWTDSLRLIFYFVYFCSWLKTLNTCRPIWHISER